MLNICRILGGNIFDQITKIIYIAHIHCVCVCVYECIGVGGCEG